MSATQAQPPQSIADCDEALAIMSAELQVAEITGDDARCEDIKRFMDQALSIRFNLTSAAAAS